MEGRAIARPNRPRRSNFGATAGADKVPFNGGPGNCPAKPHVIAGDVSLAAVPTPLQWRAGQLPGQTAVDPQPARTGTIR